MIIKRRRKVEYLLLFEDKREGRISWHIAVGFSLKDFFITLLILADSITKLFQVFQVYYDFCFKE